MSKVSLRGAHVPIQSSRERRADIDFRGMANTALKDFNKSKVPCPITQLEKLHRYIDSCDSHTTHRPHNLPTCAALRRALREDGSSSKPNTQVVKEWAWGRGPRAPVAAPSSPEGCGVAPAAGVYRAVLQRAMTAK